MARQLEYSFQVLKGVERDWDGGVKSFVNVRVSFVAVVAASRLSAGWRRDGHPRRNKVGPIEPYLVGSIKESMVN